MFYRPANLCTAVAALMLTTGLASAQLIDQMTYQGRLELNGVAAEGDWGVAFRVWNAEFGGAAVTGGEVRALSLAVGGDGVFTIDDLNFGVGVFDGSDRWLELFVWEESVLVNGKVDAGELGEFLSRQPITAAPLSQFARESGFANFSGTTLDEAHANGNVIANNGGLAVVVEGGLEIGTAALSGRFDFNNSAAGAGSNIQMLPFSSEGASLRHRDENGILISDIEPDFGGEGIFVQFNGDGGAMTWDGDLAPGGTGSGSRLTISGPASTSRFNTSVAGDSSVLLPPDAIAPYETLAEAGIANIQGGSLPVLLTTSTQAYLTRSITVPTSGYVLVLGQASILAPYFGTRGTVTYGVSRNPTFIEIDQLNYFEIPSGLSSGFYVTPAPAHVMYAVSAGTNTFHFVARTSSSTSFPARLNALNLTLLFVPTAYGVTQSSLIDPGNPGGGNNTDAVLAPLAAMEIEAEYQAELARRDAEIMALIAEQQRQLDEMRVEMEASLREQDLGRKVTLER